MFKYLVAFALEYIIYRNWLCAYIFVDVVAKDDDGDDE
jgi:hypothetical protein